MTPVDGDDLVSLNNVNMDFKGELQRVTPGSEILLHLQVESHFPKALPLKTICASLLFSEPSYANQACESLETKKSRSISNSVQNRNRSTGGGRIPLKRYFEGRFIYKLLKSKLCVSLYDVDKRLSFYRAAAALVQKRRSLKVHQERHI